MKTLALWFAGIAGWLALGAVLGAVGVPAPLLLALDLAAVAVVLALIARRTTVREAQAFLAPPREGPTALTPPGVAVEWISGFGTVGTVALLLVVGIDGFALAAGMIGGLVLSSTLIAPALAASGARTLPDWVEGRFGVVARRGGLVLFAVFGGLVLWLQFGFAGLVAEAVFGMPATLGVVVAAGLVLLCVLGGGMVTAIPAQAMLFVVLGAGILVPAIWLGVSEAGVLLPWFAPGALLHEIGVAETRLAIEDGFAAHDPRRAAMLGLTGLLGAMALPHTLLRWPAERGAVDAGYFAQRAVVLAVLVVGALPILAIAPRAMDLVAALTTLTTPDTPATPSMALAAAVRSLDPPAWLLAALGTGVVAAIVASASGAALLVAHLAVWRGARETAGSALMRLRWMVGIAVFGAVLLALTVRVDPVAGFLIVMVLAASMLLAPLALGLFWPRATAGGAVAGVIAGGGLAIALLVMDERTLLTGAVLGGFGASVLGMVLVSLMGVPDRAAPVPTAKDQPPR